MIHGLLCFFFFMGDDSSLHDIMAVTVQNTRALFVGLGGACEAYAINSQLPFNSAKENGLKFSEYKIITFDFI